jgi:hypothetical protein
VIPDRIVVNEPPKQKIEFDPFHELAFGANRVEGLEQHRPQQPLGRDRGAARSGVKREDLPLDRPKRLIHDRPDRPQRMILPHPRLQIR